ncbi:hypothetical protein ACVIIW_005229 [Bradyrhizobium sp. USDA 4449]
MTRERRENALHGRADITAAMTSDVIALPQEAFHGETPTNWEKI